MVNLMPEIQESSDCQAALEREDERLHLALRDYQEQMPAEQTTDKPAGPKASEATVGDAHVVARRQIASGNRFQGDLGEQEAAAVAVRRLDLIGAADFTPGWQGLDGVYYDKSSRIVVLEAKFTDEPLQRALHVTKHGQQMSPEWIENKAERMRNFDSAVYTPGNARIGVEILDSEPEDLRRITVLIHPETLQAWAYEGSSDGQWHLIDSWSVMDIEPST